MNSRVSFRDDLSADHCLYRFDLNFVLGCVPHSCLTLTIISRQSIEWEEYAKDIESSRVPHRRVWRDAVFYVVHLHVYIRRVVLSTVSHQSTAAMNKIRVSTDWLLCPRPIRPYAPDELLKIVRGDYRWDSWPLWWDDSYSWCDIIHSRRELLCPHIAEKRQLRSTVYWPTTLHSRHRRAVVDTPSYPIFYL